MVPSDTLRPGLCQHCYFTFSFLELVGTKSSKKENNQRPLAAISYTTQGRVKINGLGRFNEMQLTTIMWNCSSAWNENVQAC